MLVDKILQVTIKNERNAEYTPTVLLAESPAGVLPIVVIGVDLKVGAAVGFTSVTGGDIGASLMTRGADVPLSVGFGVGPGTFCATGLGVGPGVSGSGSRNRNELVF